MSTLFVLLAVAVIFIYFFRRDIKEKIVPQKEKYYTIDDQFNSDKRERQKEIDALLSKMKENGVDDLTEKELNRLNELSKK
ncbi:MAG: DUF6576 domain-containing protein [Kaistella sp.]